MSIFRVIVLKETLRIDLYMMKDSLIIAGIFQSYMFYRQTSLSDSLENSCTHLEPRNSQFPSI